MLAFYAAFSILFPVAMRLLMFRLYWPRFFRRNPFGSEADEHEYAERCYLMCVASGFFGAGFTMALLWNA